MQLSDRIGRRMKLHDLHVLMSVVQSGSMGKAALLLNTTQSAISRSITELEHAVGVRLLDRSRQGVEPTEYGRAAPAGWVRRLEQRIDADRAGEIFSRSLAGGLRAASFDVHLDTPRVGRG